MWPYLRRTMFIVTAAILLLIVLVIVFMVLHNNGDGGSASTPSNTQAEGFTFFDIGASSSYNASMRSRLEEKLGTSVAETRGLIDLTIKYLGFFEKHFPDLYRLHQQLNDARGARIEHNIIKLTFRYAQRRNTPFYYVELIFSQYTGNPLFFRIKSKKEGGDIVETIKAKYGRAKRVNAPETDDTILSWSDRKDRLVILSTEDRFGDPEYHIMIYYTDNIEKLISTELEEKKKKIEAKKKAGQRAF